MSEQIIASASQYGSCFASTDAQVSGSNFANLEHSCFQTFAVEPLSQLSDVPDRISDSTVPPSGQHVVSTTSAQHEFFEAADFIDWMLSSNDSSESERQMQVDSISSPSFRSAQLQALTLNEHTHLPSDADFLITYYRNNMGNWFSPLHSSKHPWAILHLPVALTTLAELRIWGKTKHARATILYALVSLSAFTLAPGNESGYWRGVALQSQAIAKARMKESLAMEANEPGRAKYKDLLLAFLTLISLSVASGQHCEARSYLLDAERLICTKGFRKDTTSRKRVLLHYYFLFLRVVEESTHIYAAPANLGFTMARKEPRASLLFPSIQMHTRGHYQAIDGLSGAPFEARLLSANPSSTSVLMEIYGIPLSLFSLISRVTHLANEKEALQEGGQCSESNHGLASQLKCLENEICSWDFRNAPESDLDSRRLLSEGSLKNGKMLQHIVSAIHSGLILYFYRRCYGINAMLLQTHVGDVLQHLQAAEEERLTLGLLNTSLAWPGFLAAVEARGEKYRKKALAWLRDTAIRSGWGSFKSAADTVEALWEKQAESNSQLTWVDYLRGRGTALFLS